MSWSGGAGFVVTVALLAGNCGGQPLEPPGGAGGEAGSGATTSADAGPPGPMTDLMIASGPTFPCGPAGGTLVCSCGTGTYFPPPAGSSGNVPVPSLSNGPGYTTVQEFDALVIGRWVRTAGMAELSCEQYGLEFTADHRIVPLVIASDRSVQAVPTMSRSFALDLTRSRMPALVVDGGGLVTNAPFFTMGRDSMYFLFDPWPALYARLP